MSISRSNIIVQVMKLGKTVIPPFHVMGNQFLIFFLFFFKVIFKVKRSISGSSKRKYHFKQIKLGSCVIPRFHRILNEKIH